MNMPSSPTFQQLQTQLADPDSRERLRAVRALATSYPGLAGPELVSALDDSRAQVRRVAAEKLGALQERQAEQPLRDLLFDRSVHVRLAAAWALCKLGVDQSQILLDAVLDQARGVREHAAKALRALDDPALLSQLQTWLIDPTRPVTVEIIKLVCVHPDQHTVPALLQALQRAEEYFAQNELLEYLHWLGDEHMVAGLLEAARANPALNIEKTVRAIAGKERDGYVARHAITALRESQLPDNLLMLAVQIVNSLRFEDIALAEDAALALIALFRYEEKELRKSVFRTLHWLHRREQLRGNVRILTALRLFLASSNAAASYNATLLLGYFGDEQAVEPLLQLLREHVNDEKGSYCWSIINALGELGDRRAVEPLLHLLPSSLHESQKRMCPEQWDRACLLEALGQLKDARAVEPLTHLLSPQAQSYDECVYQEYLVRALVQIGDERAVEPLLQVLNPHPRKYDEGRLQERQLEALEQLGSKRAVEPLLLLLDPRPHAFEEQQFQRSLVMTLGRLKEKRATDALLCLLDPQTQTTIERGLVIWTLGETGDTRVFELLVGLVDPTGTNAYEQESLASTLYLLGGMQALEPLRTLLGHPHWGVRRAAQWRLEKLQEAAKGTHEQV